MNKNLLNKTLKIYIVYAVIMMLAMAPVFYFVTKHLNLKEADEALLLRKEEFFQNSLRTLTISDVEVWNKYSRDVKIEVDKSLRKDSLFDVFYLDTLAKESEPYRELNSPIKIEGKPYTFAAKVNLVETEDLISSIIVLFFCLILSFLIGFYFITKKISNVVWRPFYAILEQIEKFELDKSTNPNSIKSDIIEFERLNQSIQKLIEKNTRIYHSQREFIENAAHELQTPLAVFQAKIDTLIQNTDTTEAQFKELNSLNENVAKLTRLNKNLLLLSKLESDGYMEKKELTFNEIIHKNIDFFMEQAQSKNIEIVLDFAKDFEVRANPMLTEILLSNLVLNSIRHNQQNGKISIKITDKEFRISNTGSAKSLHKEKLFTRFSKFNASANGNGLGLAIVKKITNLNQWEVTYEFMDNYHVFFVRNPFF